MKTYEVTTLNQNSTIQERPASPMISLSDAMQVDFNPASLDLETDLNLYRLMARAEDAIAGWDRLGRPMVAFEIAWYSALCVLIEKIKLTLNTRYGCND